jgi:hypothetical protein
MRHSAAVEEITLRHRGRIVGHPKTVITTAAGALGILYRCTAVRLYRGDGKRSPRLLPDYRGRLLMGLPTGSLAPEPSPG